ncbi:MAG: GNAT family N-acetyltransferase [Thermomicrobiales bacterium]|nr:GNAT family N-acetyltransferase [Thermomicrobiales bacterium]
MSDQPKLSTPYVQNEPIRTDRLILRRLTLDDLDRYADYYGKPDVARYILTLPLSREESEAELRTWIARDRVEQSGDMIFFGVQIGGDPTLIGEVPIKIASVEHRTAEIGWIFHPEVAGNGYATEAARTLLEICFDVLGMRRVVAYLDARNDASANVCKRLGMRQEAHFRENLFNLGEWKSTFVFAILDDEWRGATERG